MDRVAKLRVVYWAALANILVLCVWGMTFDIPGFLGAAGFTGPKASAVLLGADAFLVISFLLCSAPIAFLVWRPLGWGKLLMPVYGFAWIMHGAILALMGTTATPPLHVVGVWVPIACGLVMFGLTAAHQLIDPSVFRDRTT